jgi:hypothetical protein
MDGYRQQRRSCLMAHLLLVESDPFLQRTLQKLFAAEDYFCTVSVP